MESTEYFRFSFGTLEGGCSYGICFDSGDVRGSEVCHLESNELGAIETPPSPSSLRATDRSHMEAAPLFWWQMRGCGAQGPGEP